MVDAAHFVFAVQAIPRLGFVGIDDRSLGDAGANEIERGAFRAKHRRNRAAIALANDDNTLAFAVLVLGEAPVAAVFLVVGRLDVAAKVTAVDFDDFTLAADHTALHFLAHGLAELVKQHESRLVGDTHVAREREGGFALHFIAKHRDRGEVDPQRQLMRGEDRSARHTKVLAAIGATEARRAVRAPAIISLERAAVRANRRAICLGPAQIAKHRLGFGIAHAEDPRQRERFGSRGEKEVLGHVTASDDVMHQI